MIGVEAGGRVADFILAQLAEWGVQRIYGVLGDSIFPLLDAVARQERIKFIPVIHEANAAFMASYEVRLTGRLAVCAAASGPGAVNLLNGVADAFMDGSPVLAITGQVERKKMMPGTKQYFDQQSLFGNFAEKSYLAADPASVAGIMLAAAREAYLKKLPVHISVPKDVFAGAINAGTVPAGAVEAKAAPFVSGSAGDLPAALRGKKKPLVVVGRQARKVAGQVLSLAEKLGAGLVTAQEAKGAVDGRHRLNIGGIGEAYLPSVVQEADCIVLVGDASYEQPYFPGNAGIVQIHERPEKIIKNASLSAAGELGLILEELLRGLEGHVPDPGWQDRVKEEALRRRQAVEADLGNGARPIHPARLMAALNGVIPEDAVITLDIGEFIHWFDRDFLGDRQEILVSGHWRSTGCGLAAAIGAKFACPDRAVVAIMGDGGLMAAMGELLTCVRYGLALTVLVVKNNMYSLEKNKMAAQGLTPAGHELATPDFAQFARSCGAGGFSVEDPAAVQDTVRQALSLGKPALVEVVCAAVELPAVRAT